MDVQVTRRPFTTDEYLRMIDAQIFDPDDHVELIEGDVLEMAPVGPSHASCVAVLNRRLVVGLGDRGLVFPQMTLPLGSRSAFEPDLTVLRPRATSYRKGWVTRADVLLVVEVSDTSLRRDREIKVPIYARAGIAEAWIVDVRGERMFVYRDPQGGTYQSVVDIGRDGTIAPAAFPDLRIAVDEVFR